ncbi:uncharacterized protein LOC119081712 [Bradysia coprophila]|uniref:uncharacterized protein LOC119081712 n=1 Tax=Bradysia coprophila TaxID=38358 RepID=UPI00187DCBBC|nr:uncharacterized protein LOC119081712 [Bradysia coprophila]
MWAIVILCGYLIQCTSCLQVSPILGTQQFQPSLTDCIFWRDADQSAYYTDYLTTGNQPSLYRYSPSENITYGAYIPGYTKISYLVPVSSSTYPTNDNLYMVGSGHSNVIISWNGIDTAADVVEVLFQINADIPNSHMDFGSQDPNGQFFVGTTQDAYCGATTANSSLYTYVDGTVQTVITGLMATTGVAFGLNGEIYHCDVCTGLVREITKDSYGQYNARVVFDFNDVGYEFPGWMTADTAGNLYIPLYDNGTLWQINPSTGTGVILTTLPLGATSANFVGNDRKTIYAVISKILLDPVSLAVTGTSVGEALISITGVDATGVNYPKVNV